MQAVAISEAKRDLERPLTQGIENAERAIVVLESGEQVVVAPLEDYTAWQETRYLLANPANAAHLRRSIAEAQAGKVGERQLLDLKPRQQVTRNDYEVEVRLAGAVDFA